MKDAFICAAFFAASVIFLWVVLLMTIPKADVIYRCDLAEISPDFPIEARSLCRQMRMK